MFDLGTFDFATFDASSASANVIANQALAGVAQTATLEHPRAVTASQTLDNATAVTQFSASVVIGGGTSKKRRPTKFVPIERPGLPAIDKPKEPKPEIVEDIVAVRDDEPGEPEPVNADLLPLTPEQLQAAKDLAAAEDEEAVSLLLDWTIENEAPIRTMIADLLADVLASLETDEPDKGPIHAVADLPA